MAVAAFFTTKLATSRALVWLAAASLFLLVIASGAFAAQPTVGLGTAKSFAVLAGSGITNTGATTLSGTGGANIGSSPTGTFTGATSVTTTGTKYVAADPAVAQAQSDLLIAYNDAAGRTPSTAVSADLGGQTLKQGVYKSASSLGLTGTLILDGENDPAAVFVFQAGSTLTTASGSKVQLINGAQPCNVFWQVGSSATFGTTTDFIGHVLALTSITANNGATFKGQLLARNGAVTLDTNTIVNDACTAVPTATPTASPTGTATASPTPSASATAAPTPSATATAPAESPTPEETTVAGGELPNTENIDWLVPLYLGFGFVAVGVGALVIRRRTTK